MHLEKAAAERSAAGDYAQGVSEGFDVYRSLREQGYSKDEAAEKTILTLGHSFGTEMLFDKGEKLLLNRFKVKNGGGASGIVTKVESKPPVFGIKSTEDVKKVLDYLEYVKKDSTIKYESEDVRKWYVNTTSQIHKMVDSNAPNLSDEERVMLILDAYDRAKEVGIYLDYNEKAREILYGK